MPAESSDDWFFFLIVLIVGAAFAAKQYTNQIEAQQEKRLKRAEREMREQAGEAVTQDSDQGYDSPVGSCDSPIPKQDKKKKSNSGEE